MSNNVRHAIEASTKVKPNITPVGHWKPVGVGVRQFFAACLSSVKALFQSSNE